MTLWPRGPRESASWSKRRVLQIRHVDFVSVFPARTALPDVAHHAVIVIGSGMSIPVLIKCPMDRRQERRARQTLIDGWERRWTSRPPVAPLRWDSQNAEGTWRDDRIDTLRVATVMMPSMAADRSHIPSLPIRPGGAGAPTTVIPGIRAASSEELIILRHPPC